MKIGIWMNFSNAEQNYIGIRNTRDHLLLVKLRKIQTRECREGLEHMIHPMVAALPSVYVIRHHEFKVWSQESG